MMFDVIPVRRKILKKASVATISYPNVDDLRRRSIQQRAVVKIDILAEDRKRFDSADLPNLRIGRSQKVAIE
jgi:hypothetical protein